MLIINLFLQINFTVTFHRFNFRRWKNPHRYHDKRNHQHSMEIPSNEDELTGFNWFSRYYLYWRRWRQKGNLRRRKKRHCIASELYRRGSVHSESIVLTWSSGKSVTCFWRGANTWGSLSTTYDGHNWHCDHCNGRRKLTQNKCPYSAASQSIMDEMNCCFPSCNRLKLHGFNSTASVQIFPQRLQSIVTLQFTVTLHSCCFQFQISNITTHTYLIRMTHNC